MTINPPASHKPAQWRLTGAVLGHGRRDGGRLPPPPDTERGPAMNHSTIEHQAQRLDELVTWTGPEWLRMLWYRIRLTVSEMNYATRRLVELQAPWISDDRPR